MLTCYRTRQTSAQKQIYARSQSTRTFQDDAAMTRAFPKNTVGRNRLKHAYNNNNTWWWWL